MNTPKPATPLQFAQVIKMGSGYAVVEVNDLKDIRLLHVIGPLGKPTCPKCGQGLESEGGSVV